MYSVPCSMIHSSSSIITNTLIFLGETFGIRKPPLDLRIILLSFVPGRGSGSTRISHTLKGDGIFGFGGTPLETCDYILVLEAFVGEVFDV